MASILLVIIIFLLPLAVTIRGVKALPVIVTLWFLAAIHVLVSIVNAYYITLPGADADALAFHEIAQENAGFFDWSFSVGSKFYEQLLGLFYSIFGPSLLFGELLSVLAFVVSCLIFLKLFDLLAIHRFRIPSLLAYGALPTNVVFESITLRESFQVLFFMLTVYFLIRLYQDHKKNTLNLIGLILSALSMGIFHKGLLIYALFILIVAVFWPTGKRIYAWAHLRRNRTIILLIFLVLLSFFIVQGSIFEIPGLSTLEALLRGEILEYVTNYREAAVLSRATYTVLLDTSSWTAFMLTSVPVFLCYLFEPLPWHVTNMMDVYALIESLLRFTLIIFSIETWWRAHGQAKRLYGLLLVLYFSMAFMWALGTTNYGTAVRHNLVHYWIIVLLGVPTLMAHFENMVGLTRNRIRI